MNVRRAFAEKLLARIHNNPKPVTFDELDNIPRRVDIGIGNRRVSSTMLLH